MTEIVVTDKLGRFAAWRVGRWQRRRCFHHDHRSGESWIKEQLVDVGRRKMWWCDRCGKTWL
jgi:hypothetical protein